MNTLLPVVDSSSPPVLDTQRINAAHGLLSVPFVDTGTYPTRTGNHVVPWIDGEDSRKPQS